MRELKFFIFVFWNFKILFGSLISSWEEAMSYPVWSISIADAIDDYSSRHRALITVARRCSPESRLLLLDTVEANHRFSPSLVRIVEGA